MKNIALFVLLLAAYTTTAQQVLIHAHNDYEKPEPLFNALLNKAFTIEADVYPGAGLFVAHDKKDIRPDRTLLSMYLQPIILLFAQHHGNISDDTAYAPTLMIDIKKSSAEVIAELIKLLAPQREVFDRIVNAHAVQIVLSGERGSINDWNKLPAYILFDGRPYENYDSTTFKRVAFISDSYINYASPGDSLEIKLKQVVAATHSKGKLLRLWAIPDNETGWQRLFNVGTDIINTDKVAECRKYFPAALTK